MTDFGPRSATGIRTLTEAYRIANGLVDLFGEPFAVIHFETEKVYDVEPARATDALGQWGVVDIVTPSTVLSDRSVD